MSQPCLEHLLKPFAGFPRRHGARTLQRMWVNWRPVVWTLCVGLFLTGCGKVKPGWSIEAPPVQYASGPTQVPGTSELRVTPEQANYLCHTAGVWAHEPTGFPVACFNPRTNQVILPDSWPSARELAQMREHEWAHARGWRHNDDGTGTSQASLAPVAALLAQIQPRQPPANVAGLLAAR